MLKFKPKLIANQVRTKNDIQIGSSMKSASPEVFRHRPRISGVRGIRRQRVAMIRANALAVEYPFPFAGAASSASYTTQLRKEAAHREHVSEESAAMVVPTT